MNTITITLSKEDAKYLHEFIYTLVGGNPDGPRRHFSNLEQALRRGLGEDAFTYLTPGSIKQVMEGVTSGGGAHVLQSVYVWTPEVYEANQNDNGCDEGQPSKRVE